MTPIPLKMETSSKKLATVSTSRMIYFFKYLLYVYSLNIKNVLFLSHLIVKFTYRGDMNISGLTMKPGKLVPILTNYSYSTYDFILYDT